MLNALDNLPEDPVELRRVTELLASEVKAQALMIEKLQHQLHGANRHRFGSKSEGMDQLQLFAENEEIAEAAVKAAETAPAEPIELKEKPRRKPLPDHLERIEQVLSVGEDCPECGGVTLTYTNAQTATSAPVRRSGCPPERQKESMGPVSSQYPRIGWATIMYRYGNTGQELCRYSAPYCTIASLAISGNIWGLNIIQ